MDILYTVREGEHNEDLRYSLRSICLYGQVDRVFVAGYTPTWVRGVISIPTTQQENKHYSTTLNLMTACLDERLNEDFVLMNDDFIALRRINWCALNLADGTVKEKAEKLGAPNGCLWHDAFEITQRELEAVGVHHLWNCELHIPMWINKSRYLMLARSDLFNHLINKYGIVLKRSLYFSLCTGLHPAQSKDVKLPKTADFEGQRLLWPWLSVYDGQIGNFIQYPKLNTYLRQTFHAKCKYEH